MTGQGTIFLTQQNTTGLWSENNIKPNVLSARRNKILSRMPKSKTSAPAGLPSEMRVGLCGAGGRAVGRINCCWASPALSFLVPSPEVLMTIFFYLMILGSCDLCMGVGD
jgi:hypothetical protein